MYIKRYLIGTIFLEMFFGVVQCGKMLLRQAVSTTLTKAASNHERKKYC